MSPSSHTRTVTVDTLSPVMSLLLFLLLVLLLAGPAQGATGPDRSQPATLLDESEQPPPPPSPQVSWAPVSEPTCLADSGDCAYTACGSRGFYTFALGDRCLLAEGECHVEELSYYARESQEPAIGSPFSSPGENPWVAVIDGDARHSWHVGWTVRRFSAVGVSLYSIDPSTTLEALRLSGVTDAHVLAGLCALVNDLEQESALTSPPLALVMSFGRLGNPGEGSACETHGGSLSCEIRSVLDLLAGKSVGTFHNPLALVAAAGNFGDVPVFPGMYHSVVDVAALDVSVFAASGQVVPSWESPSTAHALYPGSAVCQFPFGPLAPAGSSTSAAAFAAILAEVIDTHLVERPYTQGSWVPSFEGSTYTLIHKGSMEQEEDDSYTILSTAHAELFDRLRGMNSSSCWTFETSADPVPLGIASEPLPSLTLLQALSQEHEPSPIPFVCGGCPGLVLPGGKQALTTGTTARLVINLSGNLPVDPQLELRDLTLRIGNKYYQLLDTDTIDAIAKGNLRSLVVEGIPYPTGSVSLIQTLVVAGQSTEMWLSRPVFLTEVD